MGQVLSASRPNNFSHWPSHSLPQPWLPGHVRCSFWAQWWPPWERGRPTAVQLPWSHGSRFFRGKGFVVLVLAALISLICSVSYVSYVSYDSWFSVDIHVASWSSWRIGRVQVLVVLWPALGNFMGERPTAPQGWPMVFQ